MNKGRVYLFLAVAVAFFAVATLSRCGNIGPTISASANGMKF